MLVDTRRKGQKEMSRGQYQAQETKGNVWWTVRAHGTHGVNVSHLNTGCVSSEEIGFLLNYK